MAGKQQANGPHTDFIQEIDMAEIISKIEVKVADIELIQGLLEVMFRHYDALPEEVKNAAQALGDGAAVYDNEYLIRRGVVDKKTGGDLLVYVDGVACSGVESGNPISRKVTSWMKPDVIANSFWIVANGKFICGWGEKPEIEVVA